MSVLNLSKKNKLKEAHKKSNERLNVPSTQHQNLLVNTNLSRKEESHIYDIINDLAINNESNFSKHEIGQDIISLKDTTRNIRSIQKQATFQIAEKILKAKEILKKYGNSKRAFTSWLEMVFGSKKTPYNILSFHQLYEQINSKEAKKKFLEIPLTAAYQIASRDVNIEEKVNLIKEFDAPTAREWIDEIKERFPVNDKRTATFSAEKNVGQMDDLFKELKKKRKQIKEQGWEDLIALYSELHYFLEKYN